MNFALHDRLAEDSVLVEDWPLCQLRLMNDSTYPWLLLIPRRPDIREIHELTAADRAVLVEEIARASERLQKMTGAVKVNVAALGNMVPQLHIHVVARFPADPMWPRPIWGGVPAKPYGKAELVERVAAIKSSLCA